MEYQQIIHTLYHQLLSEENPGQLADYIPELAKVSPEKFGIHLSTISGDHFGVGDYREKFSIQSIAKVFSLTMAYHILGESIWNRLGVEPSGDPFNSLIQLEKEHGIPRNPFINAGAIVICDILMTHLKHPKEQFLEFVQSLLHDGNINYSERIAQSEKSIGYRNVALCNFIKSYHNLDNDPDKVLDFYYNVCSLEMSCEELSQSFSYLANAGRRTTDHLPVTDFSKNKRINAILQTCGFYDQSGDFSFRVGLPGKSGVGGGIIAVHPAEYIIAVWSPRLNSKGNSYRGVKFLEQFTTATSRSIF